MKKIPAILAKCLQDADRCEMPHNLAPMGMTLIKDPFDHEDWQFEIKWDGFRMLSYCDRTNVSLWSRNNNSFDKKFPSIKTELEACGLIAVLDGEVVVLDDNGAASFDKIMYDQGGGHLVYYVFDILWYDGHSLVNIPLKQRRKILKAILPASDIVRFSDHVDEKGIQLFQLAQKHKIEGIVAKKKTSLYYPGGRTVAWLKIKTGVTLQGIVAGYLIDKDKVGSGFSGLIIGMRRAKDYKYIGRVQMGITTSDVKRVIKLQRSKSIFSPVPNVNRKTAFNNPLKNCEVVWIKPELECEIKCLELDQFGMMRHASFKRLI